MKGREPEMLFFNRRKRKSTKIMDDTDNIVKDFQRRSIFWAYHPIAYIVEETLCQYKTTLDEHLSIMFRGEVDSGNGDMLDNLILDVMRVAEESLDNQRVAHNHLIDSLYIRFESDKGNFIEEKNLLEKQLSEIEQRIIALKCRNKELEFKQGGFNEK